MKDYNQLFVKGIDYVKEALLNWNARRDKITRAYVASGDFATIVKRRDRCLILLLALEARVDDVLFEYRCYVAQKKEIDRELLAMGVKVNK